ncbi:hypothetical protein HYV44_03705 [Candidatus Microgenomates bacterium]|nr:hypothetical protein [Candidatus Microgenomates bacterium]
MIIQKDNIIMALYGLATVLVIAVLIKTYFALKYRFDYEFRGYRLAKGKIKRAGIAIWRSLSENNTNLSATKLSPIFSSEIQNSVLEGYDFDKRIEEAESILKRKSEEIRNNISALEERKKQLLRDTDTTLDDMVNGEKTLRGSKEYKDHINGAEKQINEINKQIDDYRIAIQSLEREFREKSKESEDLLQKIHGLSARQNELSSILSESIIKIIIALPAIILFLAEVFIMFGLAREVFINYGLSEISLNMWCVIFGVVIPISLLLLAELTYPSVSKNSNTYAKAFYAIYLIVNFALGILAITLAILWSASSSDITHNFNQVFRIFTIPASLLVTYWWKHIGLKQQHVTAPIELLFTTITLIILNITFKLRNIKHRRVCIKKISRLKNEIVQLEESKKTILQNATFYPEIEVLKKNTEDNISRINAEVKSINESVGRQKETMIKIESMWDKKILKLKKMYTSMKQGISRAVNEFKIPILKNA